MYQAYHRFLRGLLRALSRPSDQPGAGERARSRRVRRGDRALRAGAVAGGHLPDLPAGDDARRSRLGADLGRRAGSRPDRRDPFLYDDGAVSARRMGHVGERVPAASRRPRVERAAQPRGAHRRPGVLDRYPGAAPGRARVRPRLAALVGGAPRRARRHVPARAPAAEAEAERVHARPAVLPGHADLRGRAGPRPRAGGARRGHADVRDGLPALRELVPEVGGRGAWAGRRSGSPLGASSSGTTRCAATAAARRSRASPRPRRHAARRDGGGYE